MLLEHESIAKQILPYINISDIEQYRTKCRVHAEGIASVLHQNDIKLHQKNKAFYVRGIDEIIKMASHGKLLEVAYCVMFELDPDESVDFELKAGPDQYDVEFNKSCLVDVTSARIQDIKINDNFFNVDLHIREAKYDRTMERINDAESMRAASQNSTIEIQPKYLANRIAFLQKNNGKIFYIGEMSTKRFEDKKVNRDPDECEYYYLMSLVGRKEMGKCNKIQLF